MDAGISQSVFLQKPLEHRIRAVVGAHFAVACGKDEVLGLASVALFIDCFYYSIFFRRQRCFAFQYFS